MIYNSSPLEAVNFNPAMHHAGLFSASDALFAQLTQLDTSSSHWREANSTFACQAEHSQQQTMSGLDNIDVSLTFAKVYYDTLNT